MRAQGCLIEFSGVCSKQATRRCVAVTARSAMRIRTQLIVIALLRVILNTMHRMVYPFLTVFAAGLGVNVTAISIALTGRNVVGIFGPVLAPVADVRGRKVAMLAGVVLFTRGRRRRGAASQASSRSLRPWCWPS